MNNVLDHLKKQAIERPEKTAFSDEKSSVTFKELEVYARSIGTELALLSCQRKPVPLLMDKSVSTIKIMMGVIAAGGFYIILDPTQPVLRLNQILET